MARKILIRRDTAVNWHETNPILSQGEMGIDLTTNRIKIGDGVTHWNSLNYLIGSGDVISNTTTSVDSEVALFSGTDGKIIKRATGTGIAKLNSRCSGNGFCWH